MNARICFPIGGDAACVSEVSGTGMGSKGIKGPTRPFHGRLQSFIPERIFGVQILPNWSEGQDVSSGPFVQRCFLPFSRKGMDLRCLTPMFIPLSCENTTSTPCLVVISPQITINKAQRSHEEGSLLNHHVRYTFLQQERKTDVDQKKRKFAIFHISAQNTLIKNTQTNHEPKVRKNFIRFSFSVRSRVLGADIQWGKKSLLRVG